LRRCPSLLAILPGVFPEVVSLLRTLHDAEDTELVTECLYVLTNPWDPLVGADVPTSQALVRPGKDRS
jgi:importin subunit alpha-1